MSGLTHKEFNPLHEWTVRDQGTDFIYNVCGIRPPPFGDGYYVMVCREAGGRNEHLEFCPNYYHNLTWIRKETK